MWRSAPRERPALPVNRRLAAPACIVVLSLAACGSSTPKIAEGPDVTITVDGQRHGCLVALSSEAQGSAVPCSEVVQFLRDELRLKSGSIYDVRTIPEVDNAQMAVLAAGLTSAGYRFIGGRKAPPFN
jgi:hypothetical protein